MARVYGYKCDFCDKEKTLETNSTKPEGWSQFELHTRPVPPHEEPGDIKSNFLICDICTYNLALVISKWKL